MRSAGDALRSAVDGQDSMPDATTAVAGEGQKMGRSRERAAPWAQARRWLRVVTRAHTTPLGQRGGPAREPNGDRQHSTRHVLICPATPAELLAKKGGADTMLRMRVTVGREGSAQQGSMPLGKPPPRRGMTRDAVCTIPSCS